MTELRGIIASPYQWPFYPTYVVQEVIVNWLDIEVDQQAEQKMPILQQMVGFRNREVYHFIHAYLADVWTADAIVMYGPPHKEGWPK